MRTKEQKYHIELPNYLADDLVLEGGAIVESYGTKWSKENAALIKAAGGAVYTWSPKAKYFTRLENAAIVRLEQTAIVRKDAAKMKVNAKSKSKSKK
jgi:hypothetical protein